MLIILRPPRDELVSGTLNCRPVDRFGPLGGGRVWPVLETEMSTLLLLVVTVVGIFRF